MVCMPSTVNGAWDFLARVIDPKRLFRWEP